MCLHYGCNSATAHRVRMPHPTNHTHGQYMSARVQRPWYSNKQNDEPDINDPRLAGIPMAIRRQLLAQLSGGNEQPNIMRNEPCAITCRVAPSFFRIGHLELFGRRAREGEPEGTFIDHIHVSDAIFGSTNCPGASLCCFALASLAVPRCCLVPSRDTRVVFASPIVRQAAARIVHETPAVPRVSIHRHWRARVCTPHVLLMMMLANAVVLVCCYSSGIHGTYVNRLIRNRPVIPSDHIHTRAFPRVVTYSSHILPENRLPLSSAHTVHARPVACLLT